VVTTGALAAGWADVAVADISTSADIVVMSDCIFVATTGGQVHKGDLEDFTPLATYSAGAAINLPLLISGGKLYVTPANNTLHAVSMSNMTVAKWTITYSNGSANSGPAFADIDVTGDTVYTAAGNYVYKIAGLASSAEEKWNCDVSDVVSSGPIYYRGTVYFGRNNGRYYAVNAANGSGAVKTGWPCTLTSGHASAGPWLDLWNSRVIFGTQGGYLDAFALDP
jgi:outer membrane protein assembly factor BamB